MHLRYFRFLGKKQGLNWVTKKLLGAYIILRVPAVPGMIANVGPLGGGVSHSYFRALYMITLARRPYRISF